jgi:hypothetical protein
MIKIVIYKKNPSEIIEIVRELRAHGLVQGADFDFRYYPTEDNNFSYEDVIHKHTVFTFYEDKQATLFSLKYGFK